MVLVQGIVCMQYRYLIKILLCGGTIMKLPGVEKSKVLQLIAEAATN